MSNRTRAHTIPKVCAQSGPKHESMGKRLHMCATHARSACIPSLCAHVERSLSLPPMRSCSSSIPLISHQHPGRLHAPAFAKQQTHAARQGGIITRMAHRADMVRGRQPRLLTTHRTHAFRERDPAGPRAARGSRACVSRGRTPRATAPLPPGSACCCAGGGTCVERRRGSHGRTAESCTLVMGERCRRR